MCPMTDPAPPRQRRPVSEQTLSPLAATPPLIEWAEGRPETPAQWAYELALVIAKARFGPGVDMGGKHNPKPSEQIAARRFVDSMYAALAPTDAGATGEAEDRF